MKRIVLGVCLVLGSTALSTSPLLVAAEQEQIVIDDLTLPQIRAEIEKIQNAYYAQFNKLNEDDEFDILCQKFTPTGSNIPQVGCEPTFVTKRRGKNANDYRLGTDELINNEALIKELQPEFEKLTAKINELSASDDYFRELGQILQMLRGRLNEITK